MALETATHKPLSWFPYIDDTFVIWPHGPGKLAEFFDHLIGVHENIEFTMETERDGHVPFLDIGTYRKHDGSLGHRVYHKPTHSNLYLHSICHHHPYNKQSVFPKLLHMARALCDHVSLHDELNFLKDIFKRNGYGDCRSEGLSIHRREPLLSRSSPLRRLSCLCQQDFKSHQPYAVQSLRQVCEPSAEENC
jgi:hypothetical protein